MTATYEGLIEEDLPWLLRFVMNIVVGAGYQPNFTNIGS
jgi:hypothetical protein